MLRDDCFISSVFPGHCSVGWIVEMGVLSVWMDFSRLKIEKMTYVVWKTVSKDSLIN
jgi:hypothetical protein